MHPILGVLAEAKVVVNFWLRAGNTATSNNALGFVSELLSRLPHHIRVRLVRADSGFCGTRLFELLEQRNLAYVVAARLLRPIEQVICRGVVWRTYNGRAGIEHVIRERRCGHGLDQFCCQNFWATEAVLSMVVMAHNLVVLFERFLGWMDPHAIESLRFHLFTAASGRRRAGRRW